MSDKERQEAKIFSDFPNANERILLNKICQRRGKSEMFIMNLPRFGFSGAKIIVAYFSSKQEGLPFLIKIDKLDHMEAEFKAIERIQNHIQDSQLAEQNYFKDNGNSRWYKLDRMGALVYNHHGDFEDPLNPITLREILFRNDVDEVKLSQIIKRVYEKLKIAHTSTSLTRINIKDSYIRYFREDKSKCCINRILGNDQNSIGFQFLGSDIYNPIKYFDNLPKNAEIITGYIHGDLHPDNIVVNNSYLPSLIDFAWADDSRDILIDYVLLENSIRFMHMPKAINIDEQRQVDEAFLCLDFYDKIMNIKFSNEEAEYFYHRVAFLIKEIRSSASKATKNHFSLLRYLFTQFLVLYGLLAFDTYNQLVGTRALGLIADKLNRSKPRFLFID